MLTKISPKGKLENVIKGPIKENTMKTEKVLTFLFFSFFPVSGSSLIDLLWSDSNYEKPPSLTRNGALNFVDENVISYFA